MESKFESIKKELVVLIAQGNLLYYAMANEQNQISLEVKEIMKEQGMKLPDFKSKYDSWYSEALVLVKQIIPDRYDDFIKQYKNEKRKEVDFLTYTVSDYLVGLRTTRGGQTVVDQSAAIPKMQNQNSILASAEKRFESSLFDLQEVLQADIYDSELSAAKDLVKKGFVRASGAIAGVVLEKHLAHVCVAHNLNFRKKHPTISDYYELLKENNIIDTAKWRFIQHLGDIRNLCDHHKEREPSKEDVFELIEGVDKVIKTVF